MSLLDKFFGKKPSSASIAKERLNIMLAIERADTSFDFMEDMKRDILEVIRKYTKVKDLKIKTEQNQNIDMLEVEIILDK